MIRSALQRFMAGRNGGDQLAITTLWASIILQLISLLFGWSVFYWLSLVLLGYTLFRMFSRRIDVRRAENARFLSAVRPLRRRASAAVAHWRDKEHRYFRCPSCKQQMRVPRGKGRIQVTCRSCGATFEEKS